MLGRLAVGAEPAGQLGQPFTGFALLLQGGHHGKPSEDKEDRHALGDLGRAIWGGPLHRATVRITPNSAIIQRPG